MNKKVITILIIILTLATMAGGFWYVKNQNNVILNSFQDLDKQSQETKKEVIPTKTKIQEEQEDKAVSINNQDIEELKVEDIDTSNWKEYCNEEYGFCLKYPEGWTVKEVNKNHLVVTLNSLQNEELLKKIRKKSQEDKNYLYEGYMKDIYVYYYNNKLDYFSNAQKTSQNSLPELISHQIDTKFLGRKCFSQNRNCYYTCIQYGLSSYYVVFIENDNHLYLIMFGNTQSEDQLTNVNKAILKSLHFTK